MEMEAEGEGFVGAEVGPSSENESQLQFDGGSVTSSNLFLDRVGEVVLSLDSEGLSWKLVKDMGQELDSSSCLSFKLNAATGIKFSDVYAVELINLGLIHESLLPNAGGYFLGHGSEMYRFVVHGFQKSRTQHSLWVLASYTFGHKDSRTCERLVEQINHSVNMEGGRPKNLLVFIHPLSGRGNGCRTWENVAPIFSRAKVRTKVIVTQRAGHAFDMMKSITSRELNLYDGVIAVGGDGFFNEILNGLLSSRHEAPYPPAPSEFIQSVGNSDGYPAKKRCRSNDDNGSVFVHDPNDTADRASLQDDSEPLLPDSECNVLGLSNFRTGNELQSTANADQDPGTSFPHERFRLGIIPSGSTDAIVISTTGARDPVTSALHIVLGKRRCLDVAQVVRWKTSTSSIDAPSVRYAASFAGCVPWGRHDPSHGGSDPYALNIPWCVNTQPI